MEQTFEFLDKQQSDRETAAGSPIHIEAAVLPIINYAMQQNGAVMVRSVTIENPTAELLEDVQLQITASPDFALPTGSTSIRFSPTRPSPSNGPS